MTINQLIRQLTIYQALYGDIEVTKQWLVKDHYETHYKQVQFRDITPECGLMRQIVTVPHAIYVKRITGEPIMVQMRVDDESKERFTYEHNYIVSL